jgi:exodeoxyribonuclease X
MQAIILDTETTSVNDPEVIEVAWMEVDDLERSIEPNLRSFSQRYKPTGRIELGAMATHHIMDEDLVGCHPSASFKLPEGVQYLIGHNIDFDWRAIGSPEGVKRICTLALARSLYPEADSHTLSAMTYLLFRDSARDLLRSAHSAMTDIWLCRGLLRVMAGELGVYGWEELYEASEAARIPKIITFGKHKGTAIKDIPVDYVKWLLKQDDIDPYLVKALQEVAR